MHANSFEREDIYLHIAVIKLNLRRHRRAEKMFSANASSHPAREQFKPPQPDHVVSFVQERTIAVRPNLLQGLRP